MSTWSASGGDEEAFGVPSACLRRAFGVPSANLRRAFGNDEQNSLRGHRGSGRGG